MGLRRGEVWWANLPAPAGPRPVVLLSRDSAYDVRQLIIVEPVTTQIRNIPSEVPLGPDDGLPKRCVANLDTITTIHINRLAERVAQLNEDKRHAIDNALRYALGLDL